MRGNFMDGAIKSYVGAIGDQLVTMQVSDAATVTVDWSAKVIFLEIPTIATTKVGVPSGTASVPVTVRSWAQDANSHYTGCVLNSDSAGTSIHLYLEGRGIMVQT
jgi:hypothetical protein